MPQAELPQRDAQLVLAREYGFPGWQDLVKEVKQCLGKGLEWAVSQARRRINDNDVERLRHLLAEYPALLSWKADENDGGLLGMATGSFGDSFDQGIRNQDIRKLLYPDSDKNKVTRQKYSARGTRHLRLLRAHQLIYRVPTTNYYRITKKGHDIMGTALRFRETNLALLAA